MPGNTIALLRPVLAACLAAASLVSFAARNPSQDEIFLAAREAFRTGDSARLAKYAGPLAGYVLEPYLEYWLLRSGIEHADPDQIAEFLQRHARTLLADTLRRDWIRVLAKMEQWDAVARELPQLATDDAEAQCYRFTVLSRRPGAFPQAEFGELWNTPRDLPESCTPVAELAVQTGALGPDQVWQRFRSLMEANLIRSARRVLALLPKRQMPDTRPLDLALSAPARFLDRPPDLRDQASRELTMLALSRLARVDPQLAAGYWSARLQRAFSAEDRAYVWGQIAVQGARRHLPESVGWFADTREAKLSDDQLGWRARIALRQLNWTEVIAAVELMSQSARREPAWVYWHARALRALGRPEQAQTLFASIDGAPNFYGQLAAEEIGKRLELPPGAPPPTAEELAEVAALEGLKRALALYRLDLRVEGTREWNWTIRAMDDRRLLAAAEYARRNEVWDRAINTADRTVAMHNFALRYLAPYRDILSAQARAREIEEDWLLGLIRQESRFLANARSSAGAAGLMQLMPATAKWIAKKSGLHDFSWSHVKDIAVNATLGTAYLKHVLDDLDGNAVLAAAAYNAGPGRARKWRAASPLEGAIYAESIPFNETRDYVKKVMSNTIFYSALAGGPKRSLKERLGVIAPRGASARLAVLGETNRASSE